MTETLSFPGLGLEFHLNPVIFQITDTWAIRWYGVIICLAFLAGCGYALRRCQAFGLDQDRVLDVTLGAVLGGIIGARIYYVIFRWEDFSGNLTRIVRIWEGGIAIYGGIIGGVLAGVLICRWRGVKVLPMIDLAAAGLLIGQAIGRWGNFVNMEAFGANTTAPWGMTSPTIQRYLTWYQERLAAIGVQVDPLAPVHPTFFYESVWCLIGFLFLVWYTGCRRYDGELTLIYLGWYGLGRVWIEGLRTDSLMVGTLRVSQLVAGACVVASVAAMLAVRARIRKSGDPNYLRLYVDTPEGQAVVAGTYYNGMWKAGISREISTPAGPAPARRFHRPAKRLRGERKMAAVRMARKGPRRGARG